MQVIRLGEQVVDRGPKEKGQVVLMRLDLDGAPWYLFEPAGIDSGRPRRPCIRAG
jgi:hypothetical protein